MNEKIILGELTGSKLSNAIMENTHPPFNNALTEEKINNPREETAELKNSAIFSSDLTCFYCNKKIQENQEHEKIAGINLHWNCIKDMIAKIKKYAR